MTGAHQSGGYPSGGYPVPGPAEPADNKIVWIALGAIAAIALIVILVVTMTSGDEGATEDPVEGATGYNDEIEADFVDACRDLASEAQCQCTYDEIEANVPFDRYVEIAEQNLDDVTSREDLPPELQDATAACSGEES